MHVRMQVAAPVIILAFLVVAGSCAIMIPIMLYMFQLHDKGWTWQYAALFGSMLASTDAVAIIATMKSSKCIAITVRQAMYGVFGMWTAYLDGHCACFYCSTRIATVRVNYQACHTCRLVLLIYLHIEHMLLIACFHVGPALPKPDLMQMFKFCTCC